MRALQDRLVRLLRDLASHPGLGLADLGREEGRRVRRAAPVVGGFNL